MDCTTKGFFKYIVDAMFFAKHVCVCVLALTYALRMSLIDSYRKNRAEDSFCQGGRSGSNDVGRNHLIIEGTRYP